MRLLCPTPVLLLLAAALAPAAPRVDNVLVRMVPPGSTSLVGAHMDQLTASAVYRKLTEGQKLPQLDQFARETGFDPRRDVREILLANGPSGSVLLARGAFPRRVSPASGFRLLRHGQYNIYTLDASGFCILDASLAAAGDLPALEASLDEWSGGAHQAALPLLKTLAAVDDRTPLWGVSTGFAAFLAQNLPRVGNGIDFSAIFRGIESTWFTASVSSGFQASVHCLAATEKDATTLRDTARGLIGFGRLSVPDGRSDLLRLWDGLTVEQTGQSFALNADIPEDLIDQMVQLLGAPGGPGGRGGHASTGGRGSRGPGAGAPSR